MARLAPEDKFAGLAPADRLAKTIPALDLEDAERARRRKLWSSAPATPKAPAMAVKGVTNSEGGGASFSRSRRGAGHHRPAFTAAMPAPATASASPCWRAKAPAWSAITTRPAPAMPAICASAEDIGRKRRRTGGRAAEPAQGEIAERAGGVRSARIRRPARPFRRRDFRRRHRPRRQLPEGQDGRGGVRARHLHHRRSAPPARPALQAVRRRRRRQSAAAPWSKTACSPPGCWIAPAPGSWDLKPPAMPRAAPAARPSPPPPISTWSRARFRPRN